MKLEREFGFAKKQNIINGSMRFLKVAYKLDDQKALRDEMVKFQGVYKCILVIVYDDENFNFEQANRYWSYEWPGILLDICYDF